MVSLLSGVEFLKEFGIFTVMLPFLFIFAVTYGILSYVKPFGDDKILNGILAFIVAFMAIQFMPILIFVQLIVPYLFAFFLIIFMVLLLFRFVGVKGDSISETISNPGVYGVMFAVIIIGIFVFISESFPELSVSTQDQATSKDALGGIYTGDESSSDSTVIVTESDDGTVTVIPADPVAARQGYLRNTIFHPTILSVLTLFIVFGVAAYMVVVIKEG